ncbi:acyl-CoA thioesterase [Formosa maritima]|uniref:Acyl-CoA thioesterase n=1 Tax=Formosa maritima TaxID=2592046 RepID=A0A5D0GMF8_9FLAO|nr:acyl-CoA thioesterase [Formosa maritima]TYA60204.1 acyl-CoA thioesterase [Formosa maritima]
MYTKQFEIRWSDVDANRHLANSAYTNFMSHTRMAFFIEKEFDMKTLEVYNLSPVVFYEHMYYFKEAFLGQSITVSLEVTGLSEDGMFFRFDHNFYNEKGENIAHCEMIGAWINFSTRKLIGLPKNLLEKENTFPKSENFKILTKEDTRVADKMPVHLTT